MAKKHSKLMKKVMRTFERVQDSNMRSLLAEVHKALDEEESVKVVSIGSGATTGRFPTRESNEEPKNDEAAFKLHDKLIISNRRARELEQAILKMGVTIHKVPRNNWHRFFKFVHKDNDRNNIVSAQITLDTGEIVTVEPCQTIQS